MSKKFLAPPIDKLLPPPMKESALDEKKLIIK